MTDALLWGTTGLLLASTIWRLRGPIDVALLVPMAWLVLLPLPVLVRGSALGFQGPARANLLVATSMANVAFFGLQRLVDLGAFRRLQKRIVAWVGLVPADSRHSVRIARYWFIGLVSLTVGLALLHWALMPSIPAWDLVSGVTDRSVLEINRENSAKLLQVPALLKYAFTWNSRMLFPIALSTAVLFGWRKSAFLVGAIGLLYVVSPLEKLPSMLFVLAPFLAVALKKNARLWSPLLVAGLLLSLAPPWAILEAPSVAESVHHLLGSTTVASPAVSELPAAAGPVTPPTPSPQDAPALLENARGILKDLVLRRIGTAPANVTYSWFAYFPAVHPFLHGSGWNPSRVLSSNYESPSNLVGVWAYYGRHGYSVRSIHAYASFIADGWAEFGLLGVALACIALCLFCAALELIRGFNRYAFCLACYAPALLLLAATPPQAGLPAILFSLGVSLSPLVCLGYLLTERFLTLRPAPRGRIPQPATLP